LGEREHSEATLPEDIRMASVPASTEDFPPRPARVNEQPAAPVPQISLKSETASTELSMHRTTLSTHRTQLSEHRTALSEHRTDLSTHRTALSDRRTAASSDRSKMSMRRTGMSFQRTRMSADRTLMSVIRTSLSLIGFGFTIYQFFDKLHEAGTITHAGAPRNFGVALVLLGILMLIGGIAYHVRFMLDLRQERTSMTVTGLIHGESGFPVSMTLITAILL